MMLALIMCVLRLDWVDTGVGSLETVTSQLVCDVDGRQLHLYISHHDGGNDVLSPGAGTLRDQRRWVVVGVVKLGGI